MQSIVLTCFILLCVTFFQIIKQTKNFSTPEDESVTEIVPTEPVPQSSTEVESNIETTPEAATQRNRQGRQQSGDTYTLEIAFPAIKYVY